MQKVPIWWAIAVGLVWVNIPILPIMFVPPAAVFWWIIGTEITGAWAYIFLFGSLFLGFGLAWFWWSRNVPKWRLWAYLRVEDIEKLKEAAVAVGIIWRDGHAFERTEIRSKETDAAIREMEN